MTWPSWRTLSIAAGAVVGVALLGTGIWFWSSLQNQRGSAAYVEVLVRSRGVDDPQSDPATREALMRDLEAVLAQYPSNGMAPQTAYLLGNLRYASGQYDRARAAYQVTAVRARGETLATLARASIGYAWENERKLPEAATAFEAALGNLKPNAFYYEELLADLGRVQEASGNKDAAIATYRRILTDLPRSPRTAEVRNRLGRLGATP